MARVKQNAHGGDVYAASRELGRRVDRLIDFSASINPLGPSPKVWQALSQSRTALQHYPDPVCWDLRKTLALRWGCSLEEIVVGNGSTELIHVLPSVLDLRHLLIVGPTFSEYASAMSRAGGRVTMMCAERRQGYRPPLERVAALLNRTRPGDRGIDAVLLCNPNSPTGQACEAEAMMDLARMAERTRIWLIVDETFADYCEDRSILSTRSSFSRVIVLRSLTKFHGLPGLRVGYAVSVPAVIEQLRAHLPPWSVNAMGQIAATAAVGDAVHVAKSLSFMRKERARLTARLARLPGCRVFPSEVNFLYVELPPRWSAAAMTARLRHDGLLIRDCSAVPGLHAHSVRIAVRTRRENDRLVRALFRLLSFARMPRSEEQG